MADLIMPNMLAAYNDGAAVGRQNRFNRLASEAYAAPEANRNALLTQAVSVDPRAGLQLQDSLQERDDGTLRRAVGAARYVKQAYDSKNPQQLQGAYQAVRPFLAKLGAAQGRVPPEQWSDDMLPQLHQLLAMGEGAMNKNGLPNDVRSFEYMASQLSPSDRLKAQRVELGLDPRAVTGAVKFGTIVGSDGRTRVTRQDPSTKVVEVYDETTGEFAPLGGGGALNPGSAPAAGQPASAAVGQEASGMPVVFDNPGNVPPQVLAAVQANPDAWAAVPDGSTARIGPQQATAAPPSAPARPGLGVSQSPAEKVFAEQNAKNQADLSNYDNMTAKVVNREAATTAAQAQAKTQAEVSAQQGTRVRDSNQVVGLLAQAERLIPNATGSQGGALVDTIAGAGGYATEGAKATAQLKTIAGQLVSKMPRMEGPQSNADVKMYQDMAGDLANPTTPRETRLAALRTIRQLNQKYAAQNGAGAAPRAPAPGTVKNGYRFRGGDPADRNAWERL